MKAKTDSGKRAFASTVTWAASTKDGEAETKCTDGTNTIDCNCATAKNVVPSKADEGMFFDFSNLKNENLTID